MSEHVTKKGNPNPSPATRFGAGNNANPAGKTSETRRLELANAEAAMAIRARLLEAVHRKLNPEGVDPVDVDELALAMVEAAMLKLLKDSEDRGLGSPVQPVDHTTNGKDMPRAITRTIVDPAKDADA